MFSESSKLPDTFEWLLKWKSQTDSKIKLFSLNNEGKELNDYRISHFGLGKLFDGFISSCEVRMRKPDPGIFRLALGIVHAHPAECLYFDDRIILVEAAKKLGIRGFQHTGFESTKKIIESIS
jgi:putative hydrolase of the HAD superfamily